MIYENSFFLQARDKQLLTPLHLACSYEKTDVAKILLEAGAVIRCTSEKLQTPLHKVLEI